MSAKFTDLKGRELVCIVTVATAEQLKTELQFDLAKVGDGELFDRLSNDWELLVNALGIVCQASIEAHGITTDADLASGLGGEVMERAADAVWEAIVDFFPPRRRAAFRGLVDKSREVETAAANRVATQIAALDPQALVATLPSTSSATAGSSPGSSESTPAPSPSGN